LADNYKKSPDFDAVITKTAALLSHLGSGTPGTLFSINYLSMSSLIKTVGTLWDTL